MLASASLVMKEIFRWQGFGAALLALLLALPALAAQSQASPASARDRSSAQRETRRLLPQFEALPLERSRQNHLLVHAFINGKRALLGVDTGAPVSAISVARVKYFGLTPAEPNSEIPTRLRINGRMNGVAIARSLRLGSLNLTDEPMVAVDLASSSRAAKMMHEQPIDGILGADILFPTEAVLDCRAQLLILKIDPEARGGVPGMNYTGFSEVPMHVSSGYNLYVDGRLNGKRAKLMVDTGAYGTLLHQDFVYSMKLPLRDTPFTSSGVNLKQLGVQVATISRFSVGSVDMRSTEVGVIDLEGLVRGGLLNGSPPVAGLLGAEILQRHNGIIDFGKRALYLKR